MALGDVQLAGKCRINEAYNYIWMGRYIEARRIIRTQVYTYTVVQYNFREPSIVPSSTVFTLYFCPCSLVSVP